MPQRVSLKEQYDNRDVIAQIYRLIALVESSTIVRTTSVQEGSTVTVTFDMCDGTSKSFTFTNNADMTTDTEQNVTALKNFLAGLNVTGNTQIDGDTQIVNGHSLQVAGDLDVAGDTEVAGKLTVHGQSEISGMAVEESSGATVLSNANGIKSASPVTLSGDVVVPTTVTGQRDTEAVNGERLQNDLDAYGPMVRLTGNQSIAGLKTCSQLPGNLSYHIRITGTSKYELCRYSVSGAVNSGIYIEAHSRGIGIIGRLDVAYDGESNIALAFSGSTIYGSPTLAHFYAYIDNGEMIIVFGNESSGNFHYGISVKGAFFGAGLDLGLDYTHIGTSHTDNITTDTAKYQWGSL